jgi:hypothetical protein
MALQRYQLTAAGGARTVDTWYATTTDGDTAVLALPDAPPIWLIHRPHAQVYWQTEGRRGLTLSLADARQRLAMVQVCGRRACRWGERTPVSGHVSHCTIGGTADQTIATHKEHQAVRASRGGRHWCT